MKNYFRQKILIIIVTLVVFGTAHFAYAGGATLFFKMPVQKIGVGDEFSVTLALDSAGTPVNTIAGDMLFSDPTLKLLRVETSNSIVTSWIQMPLVSGNSVTFSGIMPGGYESVVEPLSDTRQTGIVFNLVFKAIGAGSGTLSFADSHLYLNDGLGTETGLSVFPYTFSIASKGSNLTSNLNDTVPPEEFIPIISSSPDLYDGEYAVFFSTTDKGSGISHYEVSEKSRDWVRADSPYLLSDQTLRSNVKVKAVDLAGNYRIEEIRSSMGFPKSLLIVPFGLIAIFLVIIFVLYERKMKKLKRKHINENK